MKTRKLEGGIEEFVEPISSLLKEGENFVDMSTSFYPDFYNRAELQDSIKACVQKVTKFRILLDKDADIDALRKKVSWIFDLQDKYPDTLEVAVASDDIEHWILIDEKYFRLETEHRYTEGKLELKNLLIKNPPQIIADTFIRQFDYWWGIAEKLKGKKNV